jgi:hypothetical protein
MIKEWKHNHKTKIKEALITKIYSLSLPEFDNPINKDLKHKEITLKI